MLDEPTMELCLPLEDYWPFCGVAGLEVKTVVGRSLAPPSRGAFLDTGVCCIAYSCCIGVADELGYEPIDGVCCMVGWAKVSDESLNSSSFRLIFACTKWNSVSFSLYMRIIFCSRMGNRYRLACFDRLLDIRCTLFRLFLVIALWLIISEFSWKLWLVQAAAEKMVADWLLCASGSLASVGA